MKTLKKKQAKKPTFSPGRARLAIIHWLDAQDGEGGWTPIAQVLKHGLAQVYDVGWIVHDGELTKLSCESVRFLLQASSYSCRP